MPCDSDWDWAVLHWTPCYRVSSDSTCLSAGLVRHYAFALACFAVSAGILRAGMDVDIELPTVVDYRSSPMFQPDTTAPKYQMHRVTGYCACAHCTGQWSDGITYSGTVATAGRTIAADPGVWSIGSCVSIPGIGRRVVEDIGGAIRGKRIDVYFDTHEAALEFGVRFVPVREC